MLSLRNRKYFCSLKKNQKWKAQNVKRMKKIQHTHDRKACAVIVKICELEEKNSSNSPENMCSDAYFQYHTNYHLIDY